MVVILMTLIVSRTMISSPGSPNPEDRKAQGLVRISGFAV